MKKYLTALPLWPDGLSYVRILTGLFMAYHGFECFNAEVMKGYAPWFADMHFPMPLLMAYIGKVTEFVGGLLLMVGLFTRFALVPLTLTMVFITFVLGHGKIFMEDQHPFLFVVLFLVFFFMGAGRLSLDNYFFDKKN